MSLKQAKNTLSLFIFLAFFLQCYSQSSPDSLAEDIDSDTISLDDDTISQPDTVGDQSVLGIPDAEDLEAEEEVSDDGRVFFSLKSPYHTALSHLYFLQEDSYFPDSAAMTLYVQDPNSKAAQKLAIQLKQFMDGAGYYIDLDDIPQDPNYIDSASGRHKYSLIPEEDEVFVYKKNGSDEWIYSYTTVKAIPSLHARVYPFGTFDWLPEWSHAKFGGLTAWQFLGILFFIILGFLVHKVLVRILSLVLKRYLFRLVRTDHGQRFFDKVARPISLLIIFYVILALTPALQFPIELNKWLILGLRISILIFWMLIALQIVNLVMAIFAKRAEATETTMDDQLVPLLKRVFYGIVVLVFVIIILNILRVNVDALLGGLAFGSLALALAAQDTMKNLFGSILIFTDRPFQIGDWIIAQGHEGTVEEVSVRSTRVRTFAGSLVSIPNGALADGSIDNMGQRAYRRFVTRIGVTYETPPALIEVFVEGIRELVRNHPTTRKDAFEVHFNEMGDFSLQILVYLFFDVPTWTDELAGKQRLLLGIMRLAEELGIGFAFPTQTLHIDSFPEKEGLSLVHDQSKAEYEKIMRDFATRWKNTYKPRDLGSKQEGAGG